MKKLFAAAFLSLAAVGLSSGQASAGLFDCFHCCKGGCTIKVRPYNAFTPVCTGSICCDGCLPLAQCAPWGQQAWCGGYAGCADGAVIGDHQAAPAAPKFQGPMPSPAPTPSPATSQFRLPQAPYGYGMAWGNGYQPAFVPNYGQFSAPNGFAPNGFAPNGLAPNGYGFAPNFGR